MDGVADLVDGEFVADRERGFGDQFRGVGSNRLGAQQPIGRGIGDPLDEAAGMSGSQRFAEVGKGEFADFNRPILFFRLGFGEADTADFGIGEDTGRHEGVESGSAFCEEIFGDDDALASGGVRELWSAIDVADREDGGRPGSPLGIDRNMSGRCGLDADSGEIEFSGMDGQIRATRFEPHLEETINVHAKGTHGGGDRAIMDNFTGAIVSGDRASLFTPIQDSLEGHLLVFAAEEARHEGTVVDVRAYEEGIRKKIN